MGVLTGPLFSLGASGTIAKTITYARWRGINYARQRVIPHNPRTAEQLLTRDAFAALNEMWRIGDSVLWDVFDTLSKGLPLTDRNAWIRTNLSLIRSQTDINDFLASPGQSPIPLPVSAAIVGGVGTITATGTVPTVNSPWSVDGAFALAFLNDDPSASPFLSAYKSGSDATSPYSIALTGLAAGSWTAGMFIKASTPSPSPETRYGAAFMATVNVT